MYVKNVINIAILHGNMPPNSVYLLFFFSCMGMGFHIYRLSLKIYVYINQVFLCQRYPVLDMEELIFASTRCQHQVLRQTEDNPNISAATGMEFSVSRGFKGFWLVKPKFKQIEFIGKQPTKQSWKENDKKNRMWLNKYNIAIKRILWWIVMTMIMKMMECSETAWLYSDQ